MEYVGVGRRLVATIVDVIIIGILFGVISGLFSIPQDPGQDSFEVLGTTNIASFLISLLYYVGLEATTGATIGKRLLGLRVVMADGSPIDWTSSIIRNVLRIIDFLPAFYLLGAIFVWSTEKNQRIGDLGANTVVIRA